MTLAEVSEVPGLSEAVERKFKQWKERLVDLSLRNRLVNFKPTKSSTLSINTPRISAIFDHLVKEEGEYYLNVQEEQGFLNLEDSEGSPRKSRKSGPKGSDPNELVFEGTLDRAARVLYTLRSRARTELEERGTNVLFIALGFLHWTEVSGGSQKLASPLVLVPVQLERQRQKQRYRMTMAPEEVVVNPAIALKLKNDFGITLPDLPETAEATDIDAFLHETRKVIAQKIAWNVSSECHLGLFSFLKFMMYKDLEANTEVAKRHCLVAALAGFPASLPDVPENLVTADRLDEAIKPERAFQILDADSSQQEAIVAALAGVSFVLQGPPGTGKSQTIANIIAECLAANKRVLFVSEKAAALDVVKRRLDKCGLGEFCLELHSHKANKRAVLEQLDDTLREPVISQSSGEALFHQLLERRNQLNGYVKALHLSIGPLGFTPFQANAQLARLWNLPDVPVSVPEPLEFTREHFTKIVRLLNRLGSHDNAYCEYEGHPWKGTLIASCSLKEQTEIERALHTFLQSLNDAMDLEPLLVPLVSRTVSILESSLLQVYVPDVLNLELEKLLGQFKGPYRGSGKYLRYYGYRKSVRRVKQCCRPAHATDVDHFAGDLTLAILVRNGIRFLASIPGGHEPMAGTTEPTCFETYSVMTHWIEDCLTACQELETSSTLVKLTSELKDLNEARRSCASVLATLRSGFDFMRTLFSLNGTGATEKDPLVDVRSWVQLRFDRLAELRDWLEVEKVVKDLRSFGLAEFVIEGSKQKIRAKDLPSAFERRFLRLWLDAAREREPVLGSFSSVLHEQAIDEFRKLDSRLIKETPLRIINGLRSMRPNTGFAGKRNPDMDILQREIQKKRRNKPIRGLFAEVPTLVQALKPCFLMSPLSVASYLVPGRLEFDVLLFDEASQIVPEDAIGSILRSPQAIVVGDTKQLPPTRFFATLDSEESQEEESTEDEILDSIMEQALASGFREKSLLWHYRSKDESLIAFSNYYFYKNKLITFPSTGIHDHPTGVEFLLAQGGVYDRSRSRTNRREAEYVARLAKTHYEQFPRRSLGIIAFSLSQADAIDAAVETLRQADSGFDEWCSADSQERFFVKNLENVQGDERDVMFFSVGYGPDENGQLTMNFGPLNREQGRRRLNVAITRAREHVKLISSFDPSQLDLSKTNAEGVRMLKVYMEMAKRGLSAIPRASTEGGGESESPFEEEVYEALRESGLEIRKQIGVSGYRIDLAVVDPSRPGNYILGIECDGATYHSFKTARDRDRLRQQVLEGLGWNIHRIWSRDWVQNRHAEIEKVIEAVSKTGCHTKVRTINI